MTAEPRRHDCPNCDPTPAVSTETVRGGRRLNTPTSAARSDHPVPEQAARLQAAEQPVPQVGQHYTHRPDLGDRTVTVTGVSQAADGLVIAYEWHDGGPGFMRGAVPLDVFLRVYEPEHLADTLPEWLNHRYGRSPHGWDTMPDDERAYWVHEAAAVRRAVARGGFNTGGSGV